MYALVFNIFGWNARNRRNTGRRRGREGEGTNSREEAMILLFVCVHECALCASAWMGRMGSTHNGARDRLVSVCDAV